MGIQPRTHNQRNRHDGSSSRGYQNPEHSRNTAQLLNMSDRSWQDDWSDNPSQRVWFDSPLRHRGDRPPQQNRSYTPQQSNWDGNRARQQNRGGRLPQQTQGDRPPQRTNDGPLQQSRSNRPPQRSQDDTPGQQRGNRPSQRNRGDQSQPQHTSGSSASQSSVSNKLNDTSDDIKCAICLDTEGDSEMKYLPCGHGFHAKCCNDWLSVNGLCPVCRTSVASQSGNVQDNRERNTHNRPTFFIGSIWLA